MVDAWLLARQVPHLHDVLHHGTGEELAVELHDLLRIRTRHDIQNCLTERFFRPDAEDQPIGLVAEYVPTESPGTHATDRDARGNVIDKRFEKAALDLELFAVTLQAYGE